MIDISLLFLVKFTGNFMLEISKLLFWFGEIIKWWNKISFCPNETLFEIWLPQRKFCMQHFANHLKLSIKLKQERLMQNNIIICYIIPQTSMNSAIITLQHTVQRHL